MITVPKKTKQTRPSTAKAAPTEELLTVKEVACILRVDATTVLRWIKQGTLEVVALPHVKKRGVYRIRRSTLDHLLNTSNRKA